MTTVVGVPRAFVGRHALLQRAAIESWSREADVVLFGDDPGVGDTAEALRCTWIPDVACDEDGRPFLDEVFRRAQQLIDGVLVYANSDILLAPRFLRAVEGLGRSVPSFLAVAPRLELQVEEIGSLDRMTPHEILEDARASGLVAPKAALDVFAFPSGQLPWMPRFVVGRAGWDGWMVYEARRRGLPVVDLGLERAVVHLDTEAGYATGKTHLSDAATDRSRRLAGWGATFTRDHATHSWDGGQLVRRRKRPGRSWLRAQAALRPGLRRAIAPARAVMQRARGTADDFYSWPPAAPDRPEGGPG